MIYLCTTVNYNDLRQGDPVRAQMPNANVNSFFHDLDGPKSVEAAGATRNTLVWDGRDYLHERS